MEKKLRLSRTNKVLAGVCGGIAEYFHVDATLIRILFVIVGLPSMVIPIVVIYIVLWAIMPLDTDI